MITPENELLIRLRDGDYGAFEQLYHRYKHRLACNFVKLLRSDTLAQDALQDLFVRVWSVRETIDPDRSFRAYLFRTAENLVIDIYRKAARDKACYQQLLASQDEGFTHVEETLISKENKTMLKQVIDQLPAQQKKVYTLHKLEGMSYKEISQMLGISPSTINKHIHHAHRFVKHQLLKSPQSLIALTVLSLLDGI